MGVTVSRSPQCGDRNTSMLVPAVFTVLMKMNLYLWEMIMARAEGALSWPAASGRSRRRDSGGRPRGSRCRHHKSGRGRPQGVGEVAWTARGARLSVACQAIQIPPDYQLERINS